MVRCLAGYLDKRTKKIVKIDIINHSEEIIFVKRNFNNLLKY